MNKLTGCIAGFMAAVYAPSIAFAQITEDALGEFLSRLTHPLRSVVLEFEDANRQRVEWIREANESMPDDEQIREFVAQSSAIPSEPGQIRAIDAAGVDHVFPGSGISLPTNLSGTRMPRGCTVEATAWTAELAADRARSMAMDGRAATADDFVIVFDVNGGVCWKSGMRITQGDFVHVGVFGPENVVSGLRLDAPSCSLESTAISVLDSTIGLDLESGEDVLRKFPPVECFDDSIAVQIRRSDNSLAFSETLQQYKRFRGTFQIGAVWTELDDPTFTVSDLGAGPIIRSDIDGSRGPQYMGSLVVYGLPHYFRSLGDDSARYSGRDIVNENTFADRLGLALSFGISDTKDTLGIGLSFEIVTGINVTVTQLYRRVSVLDGVALGDPFTGSAGDIPTQKSWEDEVTFGLSIDGRYLANFFGSGRSN